jgi:hypothetical protein
MGLRTSQKAKRKSQRSKVQANAGHVPDILTVKSHGANSTSFEP